MEKTPNYIEFDGEDLQWMDHGFHLRINCTYIPRKPYPSALQSIVILSDKTLDELDNSDFILSAHRTILQHKLKGAAKWEEASISQDFQTGRVCCRIPPAVGVEFFITRMVEESLMTQEQADESLKHFEAQRIKAEETAKKNKSRG